MGQVGNISNCSENNLQANETNRFQICEEVVEALVGQGLPKVYSPSNFISKISKSYNISLQEARTCLKLAIKQIEATKPVQEKKEEKLYAQSGYYYPSFGEKTDSMKSLSSFGCYNRLMFGIK